MPLASASPLRSVEIGAGVGGRVSPPLERAGGQGDQNEEGGEDETAHRGEVAAIP